jgi:hypothetical protein
MALNFTTNIELENGIVVENAYGRVSAVDQAAGTHVDAVVDIFINEQAFLNNKASLNVNFNRTARAPYNRDTDGTDILLIGHNALVTVLATQGITATISL